MYGLILRKMNKALVHILPKQHLIALAGPIRQSVASDLAADNYTIFISTKERYNDKSILIVFSLDTIQFVWYSFRDD